jgi:DNA-binding NarL/FixJ family response regulator
MDSHALQVVFADDNYLVREGVSGLLAESDSVEVMDSVADPQSLLKVVGELQPHAVLTDIRMPPTFTNEGIVAAKRIRTEHPKTGVVVLSQYVEADDVFELLEEGVSGLGYLLKERVSDLDELIRALHEVARGGSALDPKVVEGLLARGTSESTSPLLGLTDRERAVLAEMATGRSNAMIAKTLYMSVRAVEKHISAIFQKLDLVDEGEVNRRVLAVLAFLGAGSRGA